MVDIHIRIPADLHAWLTRVAEADHRSANKQVISILERVKNQDAADNKDARTAAA